ncbi:hypothetical protein [Aliarcobacter butzleri]|uniref:hypothetical protein n=1 Tax=Aliarcobacter butzleri TaxID=28197 RepID=UPI002B240CE1|nr:hypothetical protein [Aliarcobacter butzleri]
MKKFIVFIILLIVFAIGGLYISHVETTQGFFIPNISFFYNLLMISALITMLIIYKEEKEDS